jgi:hypothetical protein
MNYGSFSYLASPQLVAFASVKLLEARPQGRFS